MKPEDKEEKRLSKIINKQATQDYIKLVHWLYCNYKEILREYEKKVLKSKYRIEFA